MNSDDVEALKKKTEDVRQALYKLSSAAYQSGAANQNYNAGGETADEAPKNKPQDDDTIDAEYTEKK